MNKEDYVSLEVAKLLKEKGYNIPCKSSRKKNGELIFYDIEQSIDNMLSIGDECYEYLCPTLYEAQKWLRVENKILVVPYYLSNLRYTFHITNIDTEIAYNVYGEYNSYEEALNAGILEALKLIRL